MQMATEMRHEQGVENRPMIKGERALDAHEAAAVIGYSRGWVLKAAKTGSVPSYRPSPKKVWFLRSELEAWLTARKVQ
jgi:predicted DNA-binding transcriptional regulator AlpA